MAFATYFRVVVGTSIELFVALLIAEALHIGHGHAVAAEFAEHVTDVFEHEGLDDSADEFHLFTFHSECVVGGFAVDVGVDAAVLNCTVNAPTEALFPNQTR